MNAYTSAAKGTTYLLPILTRMGIEFMPGVTYEEGSPLTDEFDYVINCAGIKIEGPRKFMSGDLIHCVEPTTG